MGILDAEFLKPIGYCVDIAIVIDATESMKPVLDEVKQNAKTLYSKFKELMEREERELEQFRVKVIPFRDYKYDGAQAMDDSGFFILPEQNDEYEAYLNGIIAQGGGDLPENGLEALALAMNSDWTTQGDKRRHVILLLTDAGAVDLGDPERTASPYYPANMPGSLEELEERWNGEAEEGGMPDQRATRLVIYAPDFIPWYRFEWGWRNTIVTKISDGNGLGEVDFDDVLPLVVYACG